MGFVDIKDVQEMGVEIDDFVAGIINEDKSVYVVERLIDDYNIKTSEAMKTWYNSETKKRTMKMDPKEFALVPKEQCYDELMHELDLTGGRADWDGYGKNNEHS